jgi:hypothetical protein
MTGLDLSQRSPDQPQERLHDGDIPVLFECGAQRLQWRTQDPYTAQDRGDYAVTYDAPTDMWGGWAARGTTAIYPVADDWMGIIHRWPHPIRAAMDAAIRAELQHIPARQEDGQ